ncbi:nucleoside triphosphate pyrophosphohydrolase family protein [Candidatus Pelagibacter sp.]|jgi:predicted HAD superfamily Cof-like phosphohydrolase|nr:nucleoside triphosphate pyrophosphohydrolase family protein [Candidatus Pelagibacter sp.]|tara:strand:+ start:117 stop:488 length:372 start_codon:yes stop_codon:yes gene_type:complete
MSNFNKVGIFMKTFGQEVKNKPSFGSDKINKLRIDLIKEELEELTEAMKNNDLLEVADALTDILYVTYGAGHSFGIDLDKCFDEVQNSNMSKLDENNKPIYNDAGKVMKGPKYFKPDLSKFVS